MRRNIPYLCIYGFATIWFFLKPAIAHIEETYAGYGLIERPLVLDTGNRVVLFTDVYLKSGHIISFHAIFDDSIRVPVYFQIWRRMWSPGSIERHILVAQRLCENMIHNYTLDLHEDEIDIEEGDRMGLMVLSKDYAPIHASDSPEMTGTIFYKIPSQDDLPQLNDTQGIEFDGLKFPYTFSIGVKYEPDEHTEGVYVGETGDTGATGPPGLSAAMGATGHTGSTGLPGLPGSVGPRGEVGPTGATGPQGSQGPIGYTGGTGATGLPGASGPPGLRGVKGDKGDPGVAGATGGTGRAGRMGDTGSTGLLGPPGRPGDTGATGSTGYTGPAGPPGITGVSGISGRTGDKGDPGQAGQKGDKGVPGPAGKAYSGKLPGITNPCNESLCEYTCVFDVNAPELYRCSCDTGWTINSDKQSCSDVDECSENNGGCQITCINQVGSYQCSCSAGLQLSSNRHSCIDIKECDVSNGECAEGEHCVDLYGSHICLREPSVDKEYTITNAGTQPAMESSTVQQGEDSLVQDSVIIGLLVWLSVLSLILIILLIVLCVQKRKRHHEKKLYLHYAEASRRRDTGTGRYASDIPDQAYPQY